MGRPGTLRVVKRRACAKAPEAPGKELGMASEQEEGLGEDRGQIMRVSRRRPWGKEV